MTARKLSWPSKPGANWKVLRGRRGIHFPDLFNVLDQRVYEGVKGRFGFWGMEVVNKIADEMRAFVVTGPFGYVLDRRVVWDFDVRWGRFPQGPKENEK